MTLSSGCATGATKIPSAKPSRWRKSRGKTYTGDTVRSIQMNDIDEMPSKCQNCPYWELAKEPYCCGECSNAMKQSDKGRWCWWIRKNWPNTSNGCCHSLTRIQAMILTRERWEPCFCLSSEKCIQGKDCIKGTFFGTMWCLVLSKIVALLDLMFSFDSRTPHFNSISIQL